MSARKLSQRFSKKSSITVLSLSALIIIPMMFSSYANAASVTKSLDAGSNTINYRNIFDLTFGPTPDATASLDPPRVALGTAAQLTISDFNGNLDPFSQDTIFATFGGLEIPLDETDINNGIFQTPVIIGSNIGLVYNQEAPFVVRAAVTVDLPSPADVTVRDLIIDVDIPASDLPFFPITNILEVDVVGGAPNPGTVVSISFANGDFPELEFAASADMYYQASPGDAWVKVTDFPIDSDSDRISGDTMTITTDLEETVYGGFGGGPVGTITEGRFALGFDLGGGGFGGGGAVRPGFVLNALAGIFVVGGGGLDRTPPSLTRTFSSAVQFDPFEPIAPTGSSLAGTTAQPPLRINQNGYNLYGYSNTIVTNTIETGQFTDMSLAFEEASKVEHVAMYFVDQDRDEYSDTDPALIFDKGNMVKVDPQGIFGDDIQMSTSKEGTKSTFNFGMSFDKPVNKHIIIVAWDDKRNSGTTKIFNALEIVGNEIPNEVAHFMPIEALGEFDLIKDDNGQYVLLQPIKTETVTDLSQTTVYPEFVGRMERHDAASLYDVINQEQQKAAEIMSSKMNVDNNLFSIKQDTKLIDHSKRAPQLTFCGKYLGCELDREDKDVMKTLMWQEHLKAEKILKLLSKTNHYDD